LPDITAASPTTSPAGTIRVISVLPLPEEMLSFTCPVQTTNRPRGGSFSA
jgi:hypothetical protein